jgi:hypothetical protein
MSGLRANLKRFLEAVIPTAEEVGIRMCIHPDDPPRPLFGLPRICSDEDDIAFILGAVDSPANGLTLCSGSLGANPKNDVPANRAPLRGPGLVRASAQCRQGSRTAPSWRPSISAATPTWSRWSTR